MMMPRTPCRNRGIESLSSMLHPRVMWFHFTWLLSSLPICVSCSMLLRCCNAAPSARLIRARGLCIHAATSRPDRDRRTARERFHGNRSRAIIAHLSPITDKPCSATAVSLLPAANRVNSPFFIAAPKLLLSCLQHRRLSNSSHSRHEKSKGEMFCIVLEPYSQAPRNATQPPILSFDTTGGE